MLNEAALTVNGEAVTIKISTRSGDEIVFVNDGEDFAKAKSITKRWGIFKDAKGKKSVRAGKDDGQVFLHKLIFDTKQGEQLEFINGNSLDLRRENVNKVLKSGEVIPMYVAPPVEEQPKNPVKREVQVTAANAGRPQSNVPGVKYHKASQRWTARIYWEGVRHSLGYYNTREHAEREAAIFRLEGPDSPKLKRNQPKGA